MEKSTSQKKGEDTIKQSKIFIKLTTGANVFTQGFEKVATPSRISIIPKGLKDSTGATAMLPFSQPVRHFAAKRKALVPLSRLRDGFR